MKTSLIAMLCLGSLVPVAAPAAAQLSIGISVNLTPPPLPVYAQPPLPGPDYIWTPGYWAWDVYAGAYYWVPGTWVLAPRPGLLWTPPWWQWIDGAYVFHAGYWGPHVGFYGGVAYGFGYTGVGFQGGYWSGGHVFYNRTVTNVTNVRVTNVYQRNVVVNRVTRVSYNGGPGGVRARPSQQEARALAEPHLGATRSQLAHVAVARNDPRTFANANHGRPPLMATARPLAGGRFAPAPAGRGGRLAAAPESYGAGEPRPVGERHLDAERPMRFDVPGRDWPPHGGAPHAPPPARFVPDRPPAFRPVAPRPPAARPHPSAPHHERRE